MAEGCIPSGSSGEESNSLPFPAVRDRPFAFLDSKLGVKELPLSLKLTA